MSNNRVVLPLVMVSLVTIGGALHAWLNRPRNPIFERLSQCDSIEVKSGFQPPIRMVIHDIEWLRRLQLRPPPPHDQKRRLFRTGPGDLVKFQKDGRTLLTLSMLGRDLYWQDPPESLAENRLDEASRRLFCAWLSSAGFRRPQESLTANRAAELLDEEAERLAGRAMSLLAGRPDAKSLTRLEIGRGCVAAIGEALAKHSWTWESAPSRFHARCFALLASKPALLNQTASRLSGDAAAAMFFSQRAPRELFSSLDDQVAAKVTSKAVEAVDSWYLTHVGKRASSKRSTLVTEAFRAAVTRRLGPGLRAGDATQTELAALHWCWAEGLPACEELVLRPLELPAGEAKRALDLVRLVKAGRPRALSSSLLTSSSSAVELAAPMIRQLPNDRRRQIIDGVAKDLLHRSEPDSRRYGAFLRGLKRCQLPQPDLSRLDAERERERQLR